MVNSLIGTVSRVLDAEFGYETYMEEISQTLIRPYFHISCVAPTIEPSRGKQYFRSNQLCIRYFPESDENKQWECNDTAERMIWLLEYILFDGNPVRGTAMKYEIMEGVLHFYVNYNCFVYRVTQTEPMESFKSNATEKGKEGEEVGS